MRPQWELSGPGRVAAWSSGGALEGPPQVDRRGRPGRGILSGSPARPAQRPRATLREGLGPGPWEAPRSLAPRLQAAQSSGALPGLNLCCSTSRHAPAPRRGTQQIKGKLKVLHLQICKAGRLSGKKGDGRKVRGASWASDARSPGHGLALKSRWGDTRLGGGGGWSPVDSKGIALEQRHLWAVGGGLSQTPEAPP